MRALVTGGCGFIGSHLTEALLGKGSGGERDAAEVVVVDNIATGRKENLQDGAELRDFDIADPTGFSSLTNDFDAIFHLAAQSSVMRSIEDPALDARTNVQGTMNVLEFAKNNTGCRVVYASSCAGYGDALYLPVDEKHPLNPKSPYAATKTAGEKLCQAYSSSFGFQAVPLRLFNVYGPRQHPGSGAAIPAFISAAMKGEPIKVYGDGEQFRDFVFVEDVVSAFLKAAEAGCKCQPINIGRGEKTTVNEVAKKAIEASGSSSEIEYLPERPGESKGIYADVSLAKEALGFEANVDIGTGIKNTYLWMKELEQYKK